MGLPRGARALRQGIQGLRRRGRRAEPLPHACTAEREDAPQAAACPDGRSAARSSGAGEDMLVALEANPESLKRAAAAAKPLGAQLGAVRGA